MFYEVGHDLLGVLFRRALRAVNNYLGTDRRLVRIINTSEVFDLAGAREPVHAFRVARFADLERRINEDLDETIAADQRAALVARCSVRADGSAEDKRVCIWRLAE